MDQDPVSRQPPPAVEELQQFVQVSAKSGVATIRRRFGTDNAAVVQIAQDGAELSGIGRRRPKPDVRRQHVALAAMLDPCTVAPPGGYTPGLNKDPLGSHKLRAERHQSGW